MAIGVKVPKNATEVLIQPVHPAKIETAGPTTELSKVPV